MSEPRATISPRVPPGRAAQRAASDEPPPQPRPRRYRADIESLKADADRAASTVHDPARQATVGASRASAIEPNTPALGTNFQGIGNTGFYPGDPHIAAGPSHLVQVVNSSYRITNKSGTTLSEETFANWFDNVTNTSGDRYPFDPWVVYDQFASRWAMLTVNIDSAAGTAYYLISVSTTSDAMDGWCNFALRADLNGGTASGNLADYPKLGFDDTNYYVTSNQYSLSTDIFQYAKVRVMKKSQFYNSGNTCPGSGLGCTGSTPSVCWYDFWDLTDDPDTLQPAHTYGTPGRQYIVNSIFNSGSSLKVRNITGTWPNDTSTAPVLSSVTSVSVTAYTLPPDAAASGSTTNVDTGDARLMNAVYRGGFLYTTHAVGTPCTGSPSASCGRFYRINVSASTAEEFSVGGGANTYVYYPAIAVDAAGNMAVVHAYSTTTSFIHAGYVTWLTTDSGTVSGAFMKTGEAAYTRVFSGRNRWGDYGGVAIDPSDESVWMFHQYARSTANTWGTWVGRIVTSHTVTISRNGSGSGTVTTSPSGINCGSTCTAYFTTGSTVSLTGTASSGSTFTSWSGDSDCSDGSLTMSAARSCTAKFSTAFTDSTLTAGSTTVKTLHITELRSRINTVRASCGLAAYSFTDPTLTATSTTIKAVHITDLRTALNAAYTACSRSVPTYTDATLTAGSTSIKAVHINELRDAVITLE